MHAFKLVLLGLNSAASHAILTPPNATPQRSELAKYGRHSTRGRFGDVLVLSGLFAKVNLSIPIHYSGSQLLNLSNAGQAIVYAMSATEFCVNIAPPTSWWTDIADRLAVTPVSLVGTLLVCSAAVLRRACYRHLGRQFTFELSLREDHKLVTTGPYAYVRHPAYTGALMYIAGNLLLVFVDTGSLWMQLGLNVPWLARPIGGAIMAMVGLAVTLFVRRTWKEDEVLREAFAEEWVRWSKRTPYRLIPYIF